MDSKKVLEKLVKIAENQQKIIMKLAQQVGDQAQPMGGSTDTWDVKTQVASVVAQIPEAVKTKVAVTGADFGSQSKQLTVHLRFPSMQQMQDPAAEAAKNKIKEALQTQTFNGPSGQQDRPVRVEMYPMYG